MTKKITKINIVMPKHGETKFQPREFARSGSKAEDVNVRKRKRKKERKSVFTMAR